VTAPTTPTGLSATPSSGQVALTWSASTDDGAVTGYRIYRRGVQIGTSAGTAYTETGLPGGVRYDYQVAAVDNLGEVSALSVAVSATTPKALKPGAPPIIFDADMSSDIDDVGAITVLHALADLGECDIIGMGASSTNGGTSEAMDAINTYYGRPDIPVGKAPNTNGPGGYPGTVAANFPHDLSYTTAPLAATLYRQLLAAAADNSVVIVTVGYLTNLAALLASPADGVSALSGADLIAAKVKAWVPMGGRYPNGSEFNFMSAGDGGAAAYAVVNNWPTAATFSGFELGSPIYTGGARFIANTPSTHPANRAWQSYPIPEGRPSYDQTAVYAAVRLADGLFDTNAVGRNNANTNGSNFWTATPDPTGALEQQYLLEKTRFPVQSVINTLMEAAAAAAPPAVPAAPTNLRATAVTGSSISLAWTRNSYSETGFTLQRRDGDVWSQIATPAVGVTTHTDTGLPSTANRAYRVRAQNAQGSSPWATLTVYSGWTQTNFTSAANVPVYTVYQDHLLTRVGDSDHIAVNNDSTHGQRLTVTVDVGARDATGTLLLYFFYNDANNWYRLSVDGTASKFEKRIAGTTTQVGSPGPGISIGGGSVLQPWQVDVTPTTLTFTAPTVELIVAETPSFTTGKVAVGGAGRRPVWQNFSFIGDAAGNATVITPTTARGNAVASAPAVRDPATVPLYPGAYPGSWPTNGSTTVRPLPAGASAAVGAAAVGVALAPATPGLTGGADLSASGVEVVPGTSGTSGRAANASVDGGPPTGNGLYPGGYPGAYPSIGAAAAATTVHPTVASLAGTAGDPTPLVSGVVVIPPTAIGTGSAPSTTAAGVAAGSGFGHTPFGTGPFGDLPIAARTVIAGVAGGTATVSVEGVSAVQGVPTAATGSGSAVAAATTTAAVTTTAAASATASVGANDAAIVVTSSMTVSAGIGWAAAAPGVVSVATSPTAITASGSGQAVDATTDVMLSETVTAETAVSWATAQGGTANAEDGDLGPTSIALPITADAAANAHTPVLLIVVHPPTAGLHGTAPGVQVSGLGISRRLHAGTPTVIRTAVAGVPVVAAGLHARPPA
jgi:hypothetical protein